MRNRLRVNNGFGVSRGETPWMTALLMKNARWKLVGGGILINERWVLTARHPGPVHSVLIAEPNISIESHGENRLVQLGKLLRVSRSEFPDDAGVDLALLRLARNADSSWVFRGKLEAPELGGPRQASILGWGVTAQGQLANVLQRSRPMFLLSREDCRARHPDLPASDDLFCAESRTTPSSSACEFDSGGPLLYEKKQNLVGLAVQQFSLTACGVPYDVYIAVKSHQAWIEETVGLAIGSLG